MFSLLQNKNCKEDTETCKDDKEACKEDKESIYQKKAATREVIDLPPNSNELNIFEPS
jgi:hypothetical protein